MDYLHSGYRTFARFHQDSAKLTEIIWYKAQPGAKVFTDRTVFRSLVWSNERVDLPPGMGEQSRNRTWSKTKGLILKGDHFHGDLSWWINGIPASAFAVPYPPNECNGAALYPTGGVGVGGSAWPLMWAKGGVAIGGTGFVKQFATGGVEVGGTATFNPRVITGSGGVEVGGTAWPWIVDSSGGVEVGGIAIQTGNPRAQFAFGGVEVGGVGLQTPAVEVQDAEGGVMIGGSGPQPGDPNTQIGIKGVMVGGTAWPEIVDSMGGVGIGGTGAVDTVIKSTGGIGAISDAAFITSV